jgi:hypothetical protein
VIDFPDSGLVPVVATDTRARAIYNQTVCCILSDVDAQGLYIYIYASQACSFKTWYIWRYSRNFRAKSAAAILPTPCYFVARQYYYQQNKDGGFQWIVDYWKTLLQRLILFNTMIVCCGSNNMDGTTIVGTLSKHYDDDDDKNNSEHLILALARKQNTTTCTTMGNRFLNT